MGNSGVGVYNRMTNVRIDYMRLYLELGLEDGSQRWSYKSDKTHVKYMKNPI